MNTQTDKDWILQQIRTLENAELIRQIRAMLESGLQESEERISIEQYNRELDEAVARIDAGMGVPHNEVVQRLKNKTTDEN